MRILVFSLRKEMAAIVSQVNISLNRPTVLVFRNELLRQSETFIQAQAEALHGYRAHFVGLERVPKSLSLSAPQTVLSETSHLGSRVRKLSYQQFGFAPLFHRRIAKLKACLIHAHFAPDGVSALHLSNHLRIPLIVTLHGYDITREAEASANTRGDKIDLARRSQLIRKASAFICVSNFIRGAALSRGIAPEKLKVHYIGIDRNLFAPVKENREPGLILFVGRLVEKKGCAHLLRALAEVRQHCPNVRAIIIGDGPERLALEHHVSDDQLPCTFLGSQPAGTISAWMRRAQVFCVPSLTARNGDSEGLGMVFAEAQCTGLPVVSFAHGGVPEVVKHGVTGLLAPEGDDKKLAEYIIRMIQSSDEWEAFSRDGMDWVATQFDLAKQTRLLEDIYSAVLRA